MLRDDSTPSFAVNINKNLWVDLGLKEGGDVISLVQRLEDVGFVQAVRKLLKEDFRVQEYSYNTEKVPGIEIISLESIKDQDLIEYIMDRKVDIDIARQYCQQALIRFPHGRYPEK